VAFSGGKSGKGALLSITEAIREPLKGFYARESLATDEAAFQLDAAYAMKAPAVEGGNVWSARELDGCVWERN
jgi:hypothetical protein